MKRILPVLFIILSAVNFNSCEFGVEEDTPTIPEIIVSGQVIDEASGDPVSNAAVVILAGDQKSVVKTDNSGSYETTFQLEEDTELLIITSVDGFVSDTTRIFASVDEDLKVPLIRLVKTGQQGNESSGSAASVYLFSQSNKNIGVKESGSNETAQIVFQLLDSVGVPITSKAAVSVNFILASSPGGGEYLSPSSVMSNALGRAAVTLNTGTKAGVAQIVAEANVNGLIIRSRPILISIHGGFPDPGHFAVAAPKLNYPALGIIGYEIPFTAFVGDKFSNPVRPGTSVYFETTSGIIAGSELTDELGRSTVTLLTQPFPVHQEFGAGFFVVAASTVDEFVNRVNTQTLRLLSGRPHITVEPGTVDIPNGGAQFFVYTVSDANGNPLAESNTIKVTVKEGNIKLAGDVEIKLPDTQSKSYTQFSFTAYDAQPDSIKPQPAVISIETTGPNGDVKRSISGTTR